MPLHGLRLQHQRGSAEVRAKLIDRTGAEERGRYSRRPQQPCQRHVRWLGVQLAAETFLGLKLLVLGGDPLSHFTRRPTGRNGLQRTGQRPGAQGAVGDQADSEAAKCGHQFDLDVALGVIVY